MLDSLELTSIASGAGPDELRDLVPSSKGGNKGLLGVIFHGKPPTLLDTETGKPLPVPFDEPVVGLAFRPTNKTEINSVRNQEVAIAYGAARSRVEFFDVGLGEWLKPYAFPRAQSVAYSMQGDKLAVGSATGSISVLDLGDGKSRKELFLTKVCNSAIVRLAFTGQGESVVALTAGGAIYSIDLSGNVRKETFVGADEDMDFDCWAHAIHHSARLAVFAGSANRIDGRCKVWVCDLDSGSRVGIDTDHALFVRRVQFISDKRIIVFGDAEAQVIDLAKRERVSTRQTGDDVTATYAAVNAGPYTFVIGSDVVRELVGSVA